MKKILVTGGAGFIGSNLIQSLLELNYRVVCLDNFSTGSESNIAPYLNHSDFTLVEGDILDYDLLARIVKDVDVVSHQAALGSVPRSMKDPATTNRVNIEGTLNVFKACVDNSISRVIYAASSSTYGDSMELPKIEERIGKPLSPYAVTKLVNELYADVFHRVYGLNTIGLRYFNVFGPRQTTEGPYAAVIPIFIKAMLKGESPIINGDGSHSRDFTYVDNAVLANIKAIDTDQHHANTVYNIACGSATNLTELVDYLNEVLGTKIEPTYKNERPGDVKHSLADISKAKSQLGYSVKHSIKEGLERTVDWYMKKEM